MRLQGFRGNCDSKASWGCAPALPNRIRVVFPRTMFVWNNARTTLRETDFQRPAKGGHPCFCLPACCNCPVALLEFVTCFRKIIKLQIGKFQKVQLQQGKQIAKYNLLRKCGLLAHTSAAFLKNCCTEKLFGCLRLVIGNAPPRKTSRIQFGKAGAHPQLAWESQLPLKPCILITISRFLRQLRFFAVLS